MSMNLLITELILSINENNLLKVKQIVNDINNFIIKQIESGVPFDTIEQILYSDIIQGEFIEDYYELSECKRYAVENLIIEENSFRILQRLKYESIMKKIKLKLMSNEDVKLFILEQLNNNNFYPYNVQSIYYLHLVRLALEIKNYQLILDIKSKLGG